MRSRLLFLIQLSIRAKKMGNRNFHKSVLGKELEQEFNKAADAPEIQLTPGIYDADGKEQVPPAKYEDEILSEKSI